jgi:spore coat protein H
MDPADLVWFRRHVGTDRCFPGELRVQETTRPIWIGYRGRYSRWFRKPSYDIWFGEGRQLEGHSQLHLNAAYRDPSLLRARLAMQVFSELEVPTPQVWHVWLTLNGETLGLYVALEAIDAAWFRRQGLPDGVIYYAVGTQGNFGLINTDTGKRKKHLTMGYEKCHPGDEDTSDLEALIRQVTGPDDAIFEQSIATVLDVETYIRWLVGVEFMSHTDGLVQNYALMRPAGGRWRISPWDCDGTWGRIPNGRIVQADEMGLGTGDDNYLAVRLLNTPRWRACYRETWAQALQTVLTRARIVPALTQIYQEIRPYVLKDVNKRRSNSTFGREPARIRRYISERTAVARGRLARLGLDRR